MGLTKDSVSKRLNDIQSKMVMLNAQIRTMEKELDRLSTLYTANQQVLKDFATEEAIENSKEEENKEVK